MVAIQDALNRDIGWQIDCRFSDSVKLEMSKSAWIPRKEKLQRWRIEGVAGREDHVAFGDEEDLENEVEDSKNDKKQGPLCTTI